MSFPLKSNYPKIARESGFRLRQFKDGPIDWRVVGSMEVDRILREQQFEHIDAVLLHLSEVPLSSMLDSNVLDCGVSKYFTLCQLALQYMIFCRKFLDESVRNLRDNNIKLETKILHLQTINQEYTNDILHLHKKINQVEAIHEVVFPCNICTKNFVSNDALNVHLSKKHLKSLPTEIHGKDNDQTLINTIKLELEIKQLKERLNTAEKDIKQASEIKKNSTREIAKLNASTQIETQTRNIATQKNLDKEDSSTTNEVGTQCDLVENKEFDCTERLKDNTIANVQNEDNCTVSHDTDVLFEIQGKITKLESLQQLYSNCNQQSTNEIKSKLSEITEFLEDQKKQFADDLVAKNSGLIKSPCQSLPSTSLNELQITLSNMFSEALKLNSENIYGIITRIERAYNEKLSSLETENGNNKKTKQGHKYKILDPQCSVLNSRMNTFEHTNEVVKKNISMPTKYTSNDERSDGGSSANTSQSEHLLQNKKVFDHSKIITKLENKMVFLGLDMDSKCISTTVAAKILAHLSEQREVLKKSYPTFCATRKKLNKFVEILISENSFHQDTFKKPNRKENDQAKQNTNETLALKRRLQKLLRSPIRKPSTYVSDDSSHQIKPFPVPRKQVMFHTENKANF